MPLHGGVRARTLFSASFNPVTTGGIVGAVALTGAGTPVAGGRVDVLNAAGSVTLYTLTVAGDATFLKLGLAPGTYKLRYHPPYTHSIGPAEPDTRTVVVTAGANVTQNFVAQLGIRTTNFQSVATDAELRAGTNWWNGAGYTQTASAPSQIFLDATGGPSGDKAARFDFPATPWNGTDPLHTVALTGYCDIAQTINLQPRADPFTLSELWVRALSKESSNFLTGAPVCQSVVGMSYKFLLLNIESGPNNGRFGTYLASSAAGIPNAITMDMTDRTTTVQPPLGTSLTNWLGQYHAWVLHIVGAGTASCTFELYMDGVLKQSINGSFFPSTSIANWAMYVELGANINNGPDNAQQRWFREFGIYSTRPNMLPVAA